MTNQDSHQTSYTRQKVAKQEIGVSPHALENMGLRKIWYDDALEAVVSGKEIEVQTFEGKNVRVLFQESTNDTPRFCVVVAVDYPEVQIVTVFNFVEDKFEYI